MYTFFHCSSIRFNNYTLKQCTALVSNVPLCSVCNYTYFITAPALPRATRLQQSPPSTIASLHSFTLYLHPTAYTSVSPKATVMYPESFNLHSIRNTSHCTYDVASKDEITSSPSLSWPQKEQYGLSFLTLHSPPDDSPPPPPPPPPSAVTGDEERTTPTQHKLGAFSLKEEPKALPTGNYDVGTPCVLQITIAEYHMKSLEYYCVHLYTHLIVNVH